MKEKQHNEEKKSLLNLIEKNLSGGFSVPENYFEMLSKNISDKVQSIPNLSSVAKQNVFEVPDGYFSQLENSIRENISAEKVSVVIPVESWYRRPKLVLAYAAVLVFGIFISTYVLKTNITSVTDNDISLNDIYSSDFVSELDESSLVALLDESSSPSDNSAQIEDYMIDNNIDVSTLTDEL